MKKAFSLSITLFISFILLALSAYFLSVSKKSLNNAKYLDIKLKNFLKTKSYFEKIKFYLGSGEYKNYYVINSLKGFPDKLRIDSFEYDFNNTKIILQDGSGLINLMYPNMDILKKLINDNNISDILIDSFEDWLDIDDLSRINGAESYYYKSHHYNYLPRNTNFISYMDELKDVRGWNKNKEYEKLKKYFIFYKGGIYNFTTMPINILERKYNISDDIAKNIQIFKLKFNNAKIFELFRKYGEKNIDPNVDLPFPSQVIKIEISTSDNNITTTLKRVIDFKNNINLYSY